MSTELGNDGEHANSTLTINNHDAHLHIGNTDLEGEDDSTEEDHTTRAGSKKGKKKPKIADFDTDTQELLEYSCNDFRSWGSAVDPFAKLEVRRKWAKEAFDRANREIRVRRGNGTLKYDSDIRDTVSFGFYQFS
jgi:hypothetical protein